MPYKRILVATDGSEHSLRAALQAAQLAKDCGAEVEVFGVAMTHPVYGGAGFGALDVGAMERQIEEAATLAVEDTAAAVLRAGVRPKTVVAIAAGNAGEAICDEAATYGADLIVVGSRGLGRAGSLLVGSTSQSVLHNATVPVLVVR